jgi:ABC-2 type transport system ATP-binding protein
MSNAVNPVEIVGVKKVVPTGFWGRPKVLVEAIDLHVSAGSIHGFIGANGAGKSTTMRILIGATAPTAGSVRLFGGSPTSPAQRTELGYAPDIPALPGALTGLEYLRLHAVLRGCEAGECERILDLVALTNDARFAIRGYSKGMQQRLSLGAALLGRPRLLILDEPMSGLDPWGREIARQAIRQAHTDGATVLFSSHVISDVESLCDTVTLINKGKTVVSGPVDSLTGDATGYRIFVSGVARPSLGTWEGGELHPRLIVPATSELDVVIRELKSSGLSIRSVESIKETLEQRLLGLVAQVGSPS